MRVIVGIGILVAAASPAAAQAIDIMNRVGPSGTHFDLELPASSYLYEADTYCNYAYRHTFKVYHNGVLKLTDINDIIPQGSPTYYSNNVSFSGWNLQVGDVVRFYSHVKIISGPYRNQVDTDDLYGDCVDNVSWIEPAAESLAASPVPAAIDDRRRFETLLG
jgi:hypothetical protein